MECLFCHDFPSKGRTRCGHKELRMSRMPNCVAVPLFSTTQKGRYWVLRRKEELDLHEAVGRAVYLDTRAITSQYYVLLICNKYPRISLKQILDMMAEKEMLERCEWIKENQEWFIKSLVEGGLLVITT